MVKYYLRRTTNTYKRVLLFILFFAVCIDLPVHSAGLINPVVAPGWSEPENLGYPINSLGWEESASIAPDGNYIYFTYSNFDYLTYTLTGKRNQMGQSTGLTSSDLGDIMVSYRTKYGNWSKPAPFGDINEALALNTGLFSQDAKTYYFSGLRRKTLGGSNKSDIYVSYMKHGKLSPPQNIGAPVNTANNESNPWVSPDGKILLFESDRPGGFGGLDIWMSNFRDGKWQTPVNLSAPINSSKNEGQPFMTHEGKSLYFAGESRMGEPDQVIYVSQKQNGRWSEPQTVISNMVGKPSLTKDGLKLYFSHIYKMTNGAYNSDIMVTSRN